MDINKIFKIILIIFLLSISISICYYFIVFLPQKEKVKQEQGRQEQLVKEQEKSLEQQEKCKEAGIKAYKEDSLRYGANNMMEPKYFYNKNLNLCLYSGGYFDEDLSSGQCGDILKHSCDSYWERWIKNSFTNESIISVVNFTDENGEWTTDSERINKFWEEHSRLMEP